MADSQIFSVRVPLESGLQDRFRLAARKAGILPWELLAKMLDDWEQKNEEVKPETLKWLSDNFILQIDVLKAEIEALRKQIIHNVYNVDNINNISTKQAKRVFTSGKQNIDNVDNVDISNTNNFDVFALNAIYGELSKSQPDVLISDLKTKLREQGWINTQIEEILKHVRDEGLYQFQAAEIEKLSREQINDAFVDENGFKFFAILKLPPKIQEEKTQKPGKKRKIKQEVD
jgi:hypothetical protein